MPPSSEIAVARIGRYEVAGHIGTGGMAEILLGRLVGPSGFEHPVVIKRILPHLARDPSFVTMFLDEARIAARVRHPNVVQVYELFREGDELAMVMEYLEGETLSALMRRLVLQGRRLDPALAAHVVAEAAAGLHAAHELADDAGKSISLVHRDVSPQNVFITYGGTVKVLDFGIALAADRSTRTETGQLKGKFEYMSPEQCAAKRLDRRSDVFALGTVLYECSTSRRLFKRAHQVLSLKAIVEEPVPLPSTVVSDYPSELEAIVMRALEKPRSRRQQSALELRNELIRAARRFAPDLVADEELGKLMRELFADRANAKAEMLRRLRGGSDVGPMVEADPDAAVELPALVDLDVPLTTGISEVGVVTPSVAAASAAFRGGPRRKLLYGFAGIATLALLIALAVTLKRTDTPAAAPSVVGPAAVVPREATPPPPVPAAVAIELDSIPTGATVRVDGKEQGTTPLRIELARGSPAVSVELEKKGYLVLTERIVPEKDQRLKLSLSKAPQAVRAPKPAASETKGYRRVP